MAIVTSTAFVDLRRLADWLSTTPLRPTIAIERVVRRLGAIAVPSLVRALAIADADAREAIRGALAFVASTSEAAKTRVIDELRVLASGEGAHPARASIASDDAKLTAVGLLAELGAKSTPKFSDPSAIQRRSALALASQLDTASDLANAADMMVKELARDDLVQMLAVMAQVAPAAARRLTGELSARLDLPGVLRARVVEAIDDSRVQAAALLDRDRDGPADAEPTSYASARRPRPVQVSVLVDAAARLVVVATRKLIGERRWRRWAVLIDPSGRIDDCIHEDDAASDASDLIASLCADGYRVGSTDLDHARAVVAAAAKLSGDAPDRDARLTSAYYTGRDLLDLGDAHLGDRARPSASSLGHAVELIHGGHVERARALLGGCAETADSAAATAACLLAQDQPAAALDWLARAITLEPDWPLHHWNQAVALHRLLDASGDVTPCYEALRRFVQLSARPTGLYADAEQPARVACAERLMAELARTAKLRGVRLDRRRRRS